MVFIGNVLLLLVMFAFVVSSVFCYSGLSWSGRKCHCFFHCQASWTFQFQSACYVTSSILAARCCFESVCSMVLMSYWKVVEWINLYCSFCFPIIFETEIRVCWSCAHRSHCQRKEGLGSISRRVSVYRLWSLAWSMLQLLGLASSKVAHRKKMYSMLCPRSCAGDNPWINENLSLRSTTVRNGRY